MAGAFYLFALPAAALAWRLRGILHELELEREEKNAKLKGSEAPNFGNHPEQNHVKGRRTIEDDWRWWCRTLSMKHKQCAKLHGSDEPLCDVFKNCWLKDCATLDGKPKHIFVRGERHR